MIVFFLLGLGSSIRTLWYMATYLYQNGQPGSVDKEVDDANILQARLGCLGSSGVYVFLRNIEVALNFLSDLRYLFSDSCKSLFPLAARFRNVHS